MAIKAASIVNLFDPEYVAPWKLIEEYMCNYDFLFIGVLTAHHKIVKDIYIYIYLFVPLT